MGVKEIVYKDVKGIDLAQDQIHWHVSVLGMLKFCIFLF
jgi:hypothetical protein